MVKLYSNFFFNLDITFKGSGYGLDITSTEINILYNFTHAQFMLARWQDELYVPDHS